MPPSASILLDLHGFKLIEAIGQNELTLKVEYQIKPRCPHCDYEHLRIKDSFVRRIRHVLFGQRLSWIEVKAHKYCCYRCKRYFNSRFQGILPRKQATEPCRVEVAKLHHHGHTQLHLKQQMRMGSATVERWYQDRFIIKNKELEGAFAPKIMGLDEHFFTRKSGYATTIADLARHKVFDVVLGRSELSLRRYLKELPGKEQVRVILMDLSETYRSIARRYFANALIVADRFHVIRLINQQFVKTWGELDEKGRKHRGLLSLMRRHPNHFKDEAQRQRLMNYLDEVPGLKPIYGIWQDLLRILRMKGLNQKDCRQVLPELLWIIEELRKIPLKHLQILGETLNSWVAEIARMLRFSKQTASLRACTIKWR